MAMGRFAKAQPVRKRRRGSIPLPSANYPLPKQRRPRLECGRHEERPDTNAKLTTTGCAQGRRKALQAILGRFDTDAVHQSSPC